jgi:hypothetical protein
MQRGFALLVETLTCTLILMARIRIGRSSRLRLPR